MHITNTKTNQTWDRGNSANERKAWSAYIQMHVRCRYTPESRACAKAFAKANTTV